MQLRTCTFGCAINGHEHAQRRSIGRGPSRTAIASPYSSNDPNRRDDAVGRLVGLFVVYLFALGTLGYHLSTPPMLVALLWLGGYRRPVPALIYGLGISFGAAFLFEVFLKIVLPGGFWRLNIPW